MSRGQNDGAKPARFGLEDINKLAELARLTLSEEESRAFSRELEEILSFAEQIQAIDTGESSARPLTLNRVSQRTVRREDVPETCLPREEAMKGAPDNGDGLFKVPKVLP